MCTSRNEVQSRIASPCASQLLPLLTSPLEESNTMCVSDFIYLLGSLESPEEGQRLVVSEHSSQVETVDQLITFSFI